MLNKCNDVLLIVLKYLLEQNILLQVWLVLYKKNSFQLQLFLVCCQIGNLVGGTSNLSHQVTTAFSLLQPQDPQAFCHCISRSRGIAFLKGSENILAAHSMFPRAPRWRYCKTNRSLNHRKKNIQYKTLKAITTQKADTIC